MALALAVVLVEPPQRTEAQGDVTDSGGPEPTLHTGSKETEGLGLGRRKPKTLSAPLPDSLQRPGSGAASFFVLGSF